MPASDTHTLLERDGELARIDELLARIGDGAGEALMLRGAAGIGKTRLLAEASERAVAADARVLRARGGELEREFPFGVVRQLFEAFLQSASQGERSRLLAGAAGFAGPLLGQAGPGESSGAGAAGPSSPLAVMHGLYWLTANLAVDGPLLLVVDDAQWADAASLRWLVYLTRRLRELPVLLAVAARTGEREEPLRALWAAFDTVPATRLELAPLSRAASDQMARGAFGESAADEFCAACHGATGGNAFLLSELVRTLVREGVAPSRASAPRVEGLTPEAVARAVGERFDALPATAGRLARAVAVLGTSAELRHAGGLARLADGELAGAADSLEAAGIVSGRPLEFVHPIIRNVVYGDLPSARRSDMHARAARMLGAEEGYAAAAATQLLAAEPAGDPRAVELLRRAGAEALADAAPEAASTYLRRALVEPPQAATRVHVLRELGSAELVAREPDAVKHFEEARSLTQDPAGRAQLALVLADALALAGRWDGASQLLRDAIDELGDQDDELLLRLQTLGTQLGGFDRRYRPALEARLEDLRRLAHCGGRSARPLQVFLALRAACAGEERDEVIRAVHRALDGGRLIADETSDAIAAVHAVNALTFVDELDEAEQVLADMDGDARMRGSVLGYVATAAWRGCAALRRGQINSAETDTRAALALADEHGLGYALPFIAFLLSGALLERGQVADSAEIAEHVPLEQVKDNVAGAHVLHARGTTWLAQGRRAEAIEALRAAGELLEAIGITNPNVLAWRTPLAGALAESDPREALELVDAELALAQRAAVPRGIGVALRARGLLVGGTEGIEQLREAVATLERSPSRLELVRALTDLGGALRRANCRSEAREPLRRALELAHACGATALSERAREELVASGARPRRIERVGADALTPSERRVAAMAVEGFSNPQIAQALFVSRKTVEMHLGNAYRKLDIASRSELGGALGESFAVV